MADDAATSTEETQVTFNVKAANDQKHVLTLPTSTTIGDVKAKLSTPEFVDLPAERQRLIYSGRVLKDHDTLAGVKIKDGHTVHLVKGAASNARQNPASSGSSTATGGAAAPQVPTNIAAGTGNNPLAAMTGARYAGFHGLPGADAFGPDGGMGPPPNPDQLLEMMENPNFLQQMNEAMNNPAVIEMMQQNPMVRNNPMIQEMLRNPEMRRMMFNPEMMRMQLQMQRAMGGSGGAGGSSFPMPGATNTTPQDATNAQNQTSTGSTQPPQDPFAMFGGGGAANPFASLLGSGANSFAPPPQNQNAAGTDASTTGSIQSTDATQNTPASAPPANPFASLFGTPPAAGSDPQPPNPIAEAARNLMQNPEAMRAAMQMMGTMNGSAPGANPFGSFGAGQPPANLASGAPAANPFAALFGPGGGFGGAGFGTPLPQDNRPPEEVYESQLRQLNEMGFYEFERNVAALRRSGGNVQGAIEYLLSGGS
ncbi:hypothetical protein K458DRAFT_436881 [Lentithecium fluviatile CBS 122367]|uniref:Ubiquitin-domain-containing protein n=1 Tax=Lentithecium fluviatile CBS 122367 TaxID=1168545 RepID=A0A6G1IGD5_9PLEO|nr:hypothetical protein K458DRAFT_436881 [Lentithecium fluviatile CBS 122367]